MLRAANASHFVTYSITFSRGAEFCTLLHRCFLVEFGAMEREKVRCTFLQCRLCCYLTLSAKKRFETVENPHILMHLFKTVGALFFVKNAYPKTPLTQFYLAFAYNRRSREIASMCYPSSVQVQLSEQAVQSSFSQPYFVVFQILRHRAANMPGGKEPVEPTNEDQLLAFDPDEDHNAGISGVKHLDTPSVMAAKARVSDSNISKSHADVKVLSSAILTLSQKIDKFEELRKGTKKARANGRVMIENINKAFPPKSLPKTARAPRAINMR